MTICIECLSTDCPHLTEVPHLTAKRARLVVLIGQGLRNQEIAERLGMTLGSVKVTISQWIFPALKLDSRTKVALWARDHAALLQSVQQ